MFELSGTHGSLQSTSSDEARSVSDSNWGDGKIQKAGTHPIGGIGVDVAGVERDCASKNIDTTSLQANNHNHVKASTPSGRWEGVQVSTAHTPPCQRKSRCQGGSEAFPIRGLRGHGTASHVRKAERLHTAQRERWTADGSRARMSVRHSNGGALEFMFFGAYSIASKYAIHISTLSNA